MTPAFALECKPALLHLEYKSDSASPIFSPNPQSQKKDKSDAHEKSLREDANNNHRLHGEVALWRGVITQALMDAGSDSQKDDARKAKAEAIAWLSGISDDFYAVCSLARLNPEYVKTGAKQALGRGCTWRKTTISGRK